MASFITSPYPVFFDKDGTPLENGSIYIGQPNLNPETSPVTVYWDEALTQPAAQPIPHAQWVCCKKRNAFPDIPRI